MKRTILWAKRWWRRFVRVNRWKTALADLQKFSAAIGEDVYPILALQSCTDKRAAKGGVSPKQVAQAIMDAKTGWFDLV